MNYHNFKQTKRIFILMFFIAVTFFVTTHTEIVLGDVIHNNLVPGDFVYFGNLKVPHPFGYLDNVHIAEYVCKSGDDHIFLEASPFFGVEYRTLTYLLGIWGYHYSYYVKSINNGVRQQALTDSESLYGSHYQRILRKNFCNYNPQDVVPPYLLGWRIVQTFCVPNFHCGELVWAGYMNVTNAEVNIGRDSVKQPYGETSYDNTGPTYLVTNTAVNQNFTPDNIPKSLNDYPIAGVVDGDLPADDPQNHMWTTIQKGIDDLSSQDVLYVKNGIYSEDIELDKSITIIGENADNSVISGSVISSVSHDYELPDNEVIDPIANVNMKGNEVLLHFNNESDVGENYSSLSLVHDYAGQGNNGSKSDNIKWNTSTLKGAGAFDFNGNSDLIKLNPTSALDGEDITASSWIYWHDGYGAVNPIISQLDNQNNGYCLYINGSTNKPVFRLNNTKAVSSMTIGLGWHQIVGTHNKTMLKIYVDGLLRGTALKEGTGVNKDTYVGFDNNSHYFQGTLDEIAVWNRTLTADEILRIFQLNYGAVLINLSNCLAMGAT